MRCIAIGSISLVYDRWNASCRHCCWRHQSVKQRAYVAATPSPIQTVASLSKHIKLHALIVHYQTRYCFRHSELVAAQFNDVPSLMLLPWTEWTQFDTRRSNRHSAACKRRCRINQQNHLHLWVGFWCWLLLIRLMFGERPLWRLPKPTKRWIFIVVLVRA